jgi:hypothetical protein
MAYTANGTTQYLTASAPVTAVPVTIAAFFYPTASVNGAIGYLGVATSQDRLQLSYRNSGTIQAYAQQGVMNFPSIETNATTPLNTWAHACAVFSSNSSRSIFLNGGNSQTSTVATSSQGAFTSANIFARTAASSVGTFFQGSIAEFGIWSAALTADEIASLAKGMTCDKVRPRSLVFYAPLVRNLIDARGGLTITNNNGATVANHPRVYA